ncbi:type VI secretion system tip protein TssI/VgrG [Vibrio sp. Vb2110]|uniref:type VI secretion system Vgr family protein n=1 Tax=unclassified Vibrio TaxID=2614977 RepID=UPI0029644E0C|nr:MULTISPECIES: type VI secretion system tip protein TssI/VgrG [unclassified Vibrio]MDW1846385.1 type VI secretion system tip protein TssI/VgrG [Vibrio sp. Vb2130]MDW1880504.1 type VI secretion system tip protein TssI/VgrG [Vibrio sp. Vb2110]MDW2040849.1 type VI secretion system tip protein TssI/VgrG [Vibrio sp. 2130-1]MDW2135986.1 type VI secretion system tip protein TssI/VgrG [Vibrio sp. 2128(2023)]
MTSSELLDKSRPLTAKLADNKKYVVTHLTGEEAVSEGCRFSLSVASNAVINESNLGKSVSISLEQSFETRTLSGLCISIEFTGFSQEKQLYFYQIEAADPLALLAYRRDRKIFQNMTTKQILNTLLGESNLKNYFSFSVSGGGKKHDYCVQLDETDQQFVRRLLASEGWHFHVRHDSGKPSVMIADSNQRFEPIPEPKLYYQDGCQAAHRALSNWSYATHIGSAKVSLADHTQELAEVFESGERKSAFDNCPPALAQHWFGLGLNNKNEARDAAKRQMDALDAVKSVSKASSSIAALACGFTFRLHQHPLSSMNQEYVVTQLTHHVSTDEGGTSPVYRNQFHCIPVSVTYSPQVQDKPKVNSVHTASVTGPSGEEIYRDKAGRIKVQFHWDKHGKRDENSSCWLPVSQGVASKGFGAQFTPRIGDEVLVQYIDGDPDRPVVVGSLYNTKNEVPYSAATQSGLKTRSTPKGSSKQGNELRFEDQKDNEHIFLHAEKDMLIEVNNDNQTTIKGAKRTRVDKTVALNAKEAIQVEGDKTITVKSKEDWTGDSGKDLNLSAAANMALSAKSSVTVDGSTISLIGKSKIEFKVGASKIEISASGIKIDAPQVAIYGQAKAEMKAAMVNIEGQAKADVKAALVTVNGSAMTQVKAGAMVQIQGAITKVN